MLSKIHFSCEISGSHDGEYKDDCLLGAQHLRRESSLYLVLVLHPPIILLLLFLGRVAVEHLRLVLHTSLISAQLCGLRRGKRACIIHCIHFIWTRRSVKAGALGHTVSQERAESCPNKILAVYMYPDLGSRWEWPASCRRWDDWMCSDSERGADEKWFGRAGNRTPASVLSVASHFNTLTCYLNALFINAVRPLRLSLFVPSISSRFFTALFFFLLNCLYAVRISRRSSAGGILFYCVLFLLGATNDLRLDCHS
jgi:hypothetical protein